MATNASCRTRPASARVADVFSSFIDVDDKPVRIKAPAYWSLLPLRRALLFGGACWLLFVVWLDPPFALYWLLGNLLVGLVAASELAQRSASGTTSAAVKRRVLGLALLALAGSTALLVFLREFEVNDLAHYEATRLSLGGEGEDANSSETRAAATGTLRVHFLCLYNPELRYGDDVETIHRAMNRHAIRNSAEPTTQAEANADAPSVSVQRYAVNPAINAWSSDVLRFNILLQFWDQADERLQQRLGGSRAPAADILCVAETDVVFHEAYFATTLRAAAPEALEFAHIQHFWGHRTLEPFNIGVVCTSSRASIRTRLWVRLMRALHAKRYRRLLYLDALYAFVPSRFVFAWDEHHGCTEYYPHCHYVHFTRPKAVAIENALRAIAYEKKEAGL